MKKFIVLALMLLISTSAFAAGITASKHNFASQTWTTEICAPCHTPHNAFSTDAPLWSHADTTQTFNMYSSPTALMVANGGTPATAPANNSLACLSCHDGVTFMDDFIGTASGTPAAVMSTVGPTLGTDLSNDHPISFTYDDTVNSASGYNLIGDIKAAGLPFFGTGADQLECATCHDVHDNGGFTSMLRVTPAVSELCLTCHNK